MSDSRRTRHRDWDEPDRRDRRDDHRDHDRDRRQYRSRSRDRDNRRGGQRDRSRSPDRGGGRGRGRGRGRDNGRGGGGRYDDRDTRRRGDDDRDHRDRYRGEDDRDSREPRRRSPSLRPNKRNSPPPKNTKPEPMQQDAPNSNSEGEAEEDDIASMQAMMGFGDFGTTKNSKVVGNEHGAVRKEKKSEYRQYMNRQGGFNRPLSPSRE